MTRRRTIVCLSSQSWTDGMWTNKQHIMSRLGRRHQVLHVNFGPHNLRPLMRNKLAARPSAAWQPLDLLLGPQVHDCDGIRALDFWSPHMPDRAPGDPRWVLANFDMRVLLLRRYLWSRRIRDPILWVYHPGYGPAVRHIPHRLLVYDCVDEYTQFPEYKQRPEWLAKRERGLIQCADVVFTTSQGLYDTKRALNPDNTYLVHNVGDAAHFRRAMAAETVVPDDLAALPKPVIGFVGAISDYKLNGEWLQALAVARRDWSIALIGPVGVGDEHTDVARLREHPNIHLLGHRPYATLPGYVKGFDVAMIPYRLNEYTRYSFPIKFFEFLSSGKPVVISPLEAVAAYHDAVLVAHDASELVERCEQALADPRAGLEQRLELADANTWSSRVERLWNEVERRLV